VSTEPFRAPNQAGSPVPGQPETDNVVTPDPAPEIVSPARLAWLRSVLRETAARVGAAESVSPAQKARTLACLEALEAQAAATDNVITPPAAANDRPAHDGPNPQPPTTNPQQLTPNTKSLSAGPESPRHSDNVITPLASAQAEPRSLALAGICREAELWPRRRLNPARVRTFAALYAAGGPGAMPPILAAEVDGRRYLVDGWHRCAAAERAGLTTLPAVLKPVERREAVYVEAAACSAVSSQPLTRAEKRAAVDRLLTLLDPA